jgi:hypothetical protein
MNFKARTAFFVVYGPLAGLDAAVDDSYSGPRPPPLHPLSVQDGELRDDEMHNCSTIDRELTEEWVRTLIDYQRGQKTKTLLHKA